MVARFEGPKPALQSLLVGVLNVVIQLDLTHVFPHTENVIILHMVQENLRPGNPDGRDNDLQSMYKS